MPSAVASSIRSRPQAANQAYRARAEQLARSGFVGQKQKLFARRIHDWQAIAHKLVVPTNSRAKRADAAARERIS